MPTARLPDRKGTHVPAEPVDPEASDPADLAIAAEAARLARARLRALPQLERTIVILGAAGFAPSEIATIVGLSERAVRKRVTRANKQGDVVTLKPMGEHSPEAAGPGREAAEPGPAAANPGPPDHQRPILAVDVDGVISLFGFEGPLEEVGGRFHLIDGIAHCISDRAGAQLLRLADAYELVWATGWEDRANDHLPLLLGLPGALPCLRFNGRARFGTAHWKLEAIEEYARDRPLAWVDDSLDESCRDWAARRMAPTLLVPTESEIGITEAHTETLLAWAARGYTAD